MTNALTLWNDADVAHVRATVAPQANDQEFRLLIYMANRYQLDPLLRQIWCVKYSDRPAQIFAGRDGFLAIAHRSGAFDGLETTVRVEQVPLSVAPRGGAAFARDYQFVATCRAYNKSAAHPVTAEVWEAEYTTGRDLWASKPRTMIAKVAECQALRKAFNISGLYDPDEMGEAGRPAVEVLDADAHRPVPSLVGSAHLVPDGTFTRIGEADLERATRAARAIGLSRGDVRKRLERYGVAEFAQLSAADGAREAADLEEVAAQIHAGVS